MIYCLGSQWRTIPAGVTQGSMLGPILCFSYESLKMLSSKILHAHDTTLYGTINGERQLNGDLTQESR